MRHAREDIRKGMMLTGGPGPVEIVPSKRDRITKDMFMTLDCPVFMRMDASSPQQQQQQPSPFTEVGQRMDSLKIKLEALAAILRAAKQS